jgi:hypothetical protein
MDARHEELEVVALKAAVGRWPAGTTGTIVKADADTALVEISDDRGHALDFVSVPHAALLVASGGISQAAR